MDQQPAFYFDLASPESYLAAERILTLLPLAAEWIPIRGSALPALGDAAAQRELVESLAEERSLQQPRWPTPFPFDSEQAMLAATYAKQIGRTVPFVLAAFRQAYAGGRALDNDDNIVIAGSACEMHPAALLKGCKLRTVLGGLEAATALALERGVRDVPAVWVPGTGGGPDQLFHGDDQLEAAAAALSEKVATQ
jgi:2-hydroxychromene-2-carboxylate isomerase